MGRWLGLGSVPRIEARVVMESSLSTSGDGGVHTRARLVHEESAARHEAAAAMWEEWGDAEWAEFERRCAKLERQWARLEADRSNLQQLRVHSLGEDDGVASVEVERVTSEIAPRAAQLKADDVVLERERARLRREQGHEQRGPWVAARMAD